MDWSREPGRFVWTELESADAFGRTPAEMAVGSDNIVNTGRSWYTWSKCKSE